MMRPPMPDILTRSVQRWLRKPARSGHGANGAAAPAHPPVEHSFMQHYERLGIPRKLHYPSTTVGHLLNQSAQRFADAPALIYGDLHWNYAELNQKTNRVAAALAMQGVSQGDRVLMTLPNCPEFVTCFLAAHKLGAVLVNAGPLMGADDLATLMEMTAPRAVIALDLQAPLLDRAAYQWPEVRRIWVSLKNYQTVWKRVGYRVKLFQSRRYATDKHNINAPDGAELYELMAQAPSRPPTVAPEPDDLAVLQPTGGTTGVLKVAQLTHRNLIANAAQLSVWARLRAAQERVLAVLPMFHVFGLSTCLTTAIYNSSTIMPLTRFRIEQVIDTIAQHRPTVLPLAPVVVEAICKHLEEHPNREVVDVIQKAVVLSGAAPLTPQMSQRFERITGMRICQGYGLTEASPVTHANPIDQCREGSIGIPLPDTHVRVTSLSGEDKPVEPGEAGELWVTGPQIMLGYLGNPDANERMLSIDKQGRRWLRTGDVVRVDDDGYFRVVDRQKDMINRGGLKVWPAKIEQVITQHSQVADVAVIGRPDPVHTEVVVAIVAPVRGSGKPDEMKELEVALRIYCREHLAPYEVPGIFEFVNELPRSALGKMLKYRLRASHGPDSNGNGNGEATEAPHTAEQEAL